MILPAAHDHDVTTFGPLEWALVGVAAIVTAWVVWRAVVLTARPGEDDPSHVKHSILVDEDPSGPQPDPSPDR